MAEEEERRASPLTLALLAGGGACAAVDAALHPLDTLRTRLQSRAGLRKAGGFGAVYRGVLPAALGAAPGAVLFFSTYEAMKEVLKSHCGDQESWRQHAAAASCGEVAACLVRVPTAVVTQRMQVGQFRCLTQALARSRRGGGLRAFYAGCGAAVMRDVPFAFIQFPIYEQLKWLWSIWECREINPLEGAACGSFSGAVAGACTTPLDVAKTRIMLENPAPGQEARYTGTVSTLWTIAREEGVTALFKGIGPRVTWITTGGFLFFGCYESATEALWSTGLW